MFDILDYRLQVLDVLKQTGNHYDTSVIELERLNTKVKYHRWLHPYQGDWEVDYVLL